MSWAKGKITLNLKQLITECDNYHGFSAFFHQNSDF